MDDTDDVSLFPSSDCTDGTDEDSKYCGGEKELSIWLCFLSHQLFPPTFLAFDCPGQIRCANPGSGRACVPKTWMCDGAR